MDKSNELDFKKMVLKHRKESFFELMKWIIPSITFLIAVFGSEKWVLAYGFFIIIFGLLIISEQMEKIINLQSPKE
jgi:hypothetical protein